MSITPTVSSDHRRSTEPVLAAALHLRDPLALAEAYHRTVNAAHACAWRLLASTDEVETLLYRTYRDLWEHPVDPPLEGWVRHHCFGLGVDYLRGRQQSAASPSTAAVLTELGTPRRPLTGAAEQVLASLDEQARAALVLAHDAGIPTWEQEDPRAGAALDRALLALASADEEGDGGATVPLLGDWTLGLLPTEDAAALESAIADRPHWGARARLLRRGRRRVEGLPPHPDMGQRILVTILAAGPAIQDVPDDDPTLETEPLPRRPLLARLLRR
jgi:hypothetical protein